MSHVNTIRHYINLAYKEATGEELTWECQRELRDALIAWGEKIESRAVKRIREEGEQAPEDRQPPHD